MAYHLLSSNGTAQNENKFRTQKPTPFNDPGTVPVRLASVPFERRNEPINVMIDEPPKPRPRASASSAPASAPSRATAGTTGRRNTSSEFTPS